MVNGIFHLGIRFNLGARVSVSPGQFLVAEGEMPPAHAE
jgi:hypothetical protein